MSMHIYWCRRCRASFVEQDWDQEHGCCKGCSPRKHKYGNRKTEVDGIRFDSAKEAGRYKELLLRQRAGEIRDLVLQPLYPLIVNGVLIAHYKGDFRYVDVGTGSTIVEDVKSVATARDKAYRLKWKLVKALYGITVVEVL